MDYSSPIDNDDVFHKDAFKTIQRNFVSKDKYLTSLTSGYTLNLQTRQIGHYYYPASPFTNIFEYKEKFKSIYYKSHAH